MIKFLKIYISTFLIFLALDAYWLSEVSPDFYRAHIGHLMAEKPDLGAALVFYLIFIAGLVWFVIKPALSEPRWHRAALQGGFFGLVTYATFDLTCQAVLKEWPVILTLIDLAWGSFICAGTTLVTRRVFRDRGTQGSH